MTIKKLTVIAIAGAALLAGAIGISMRLTRPHEMELEVPPVEQGAQNITENGTHTLGDMENIPLYYDDTEVLLLPLRNVMEGLGGSVSWEKETRNVEVSYRGRKLVLNPGEADALLNGYEITLPKAAEMINGCLYADEQLIAAYYTGDVVWNNDSRQITLQTKDNAVPVVAMKKISGEKDGRAYEIDVPVIVGLNDAKYEKNLNESILREMREMGESFLLEEEEGEALLQLETHSGLTVQNFLSIWWEGTKDGSSVKLAKNIDLLGQKQVTLADLLKEAALEEVRTTAGEGWTEDRFFLTEEGGLVLLKGSNANSLEMHHWTTEGRQPEWKDSFRELLQKKN